MKLNSKYFCISVCLLFFISFKTYAQTAPQGFNYQTIIRNAAGVLLPNQSVQLRFSFYSGSANGILQWQEDHLLITDGYGKIKIIIGTGSSTGAGATASFAQINWSGGMYFLKVSLDATGGTNFTDMGTSQLFSVPYAFFANTANAVDSMYLWQMQDVDITGIAVNKVLKYNGTYWVPGIDNHHDTVSFAYTASYSHSTDTAYNVITTTAPDTVLFTYFTDSSLFSTNSGFSNNTNHANYANIALYAFNVPPSGWTLTGNSIGTQLKYLGTNDAPDLIMKTNNTERWKIKNNGDVTVGISANIAELALAGNDGILATGTLISPIPTVSGAGTRMLWYPAKAAFRAGGVSGNQWDTANIGYYSFATGYNNKAGRYSFSAGRECVTGDWTIAIGRKSMATATGAVGVAGSAVTGVALGDSCVAAAVRSVSIGRGNVTNASTDVALGTNNKCIGVVSLCIGNNCTTNAHYSTAMGNRAVSASNAYGSFTFADNSTTAPLANIIPKSFQARADGGVVFYSSALMGAGPMVWLPPGGGAWAGTSDRNKKENFEAVDCEKILKKIAKLNITSWNYKSQDRSIRHIGPMAQEFYSAFKMGENKLFISTTDMDGIIVAGIKGVNTRLNNLKTINEIDEIKNKVEEINNFDDLNKRLDIIENTMIKK